MAKQYRWTKRTAEEMRGNVAWTTKPTKSRWDVRSRQGEVVGVTKTRSGWLFTVEWEDDPGQLVFYTGEEVHRMTCRYGGPSSLMVSPGQMDNPRRVVV